MPGSPVEVKIQPRSSPPSMPPLPPVNPGGPRPMSFTPTALPNGINHSPPTLNGAPSPPQRFSNGPASSSSSSLTNQQLPATCGARQLSKLKRFLTTLQQFGNDISPEIGEKVRSLVLALVNSTVTIEEFHCKLQEATNFPLRPFVIPFLKANLPLLQRELLHCARAAKQTPSQYLAQHEHILLNTNTTSPADSSELLIEVNGNGKRHSPDRREENNFERESLPTEPPAKRVCTISPAPRHSPALTMPLMNPAGQFHPTPPPLQHYTLEDIATSHLYRDPSKMLEHRDIRDRHNSLGLNGGYQDELVDHRLTEREWADEWKHLDHALNCIMEMVEKTRRSMAVLRRCQEADREELNYWKRRCSETAETRKAGSELISRQHSPSSSDSISSELLELRSQGQRDVQWLQHRPLLRLFLPAQGLGEAPPNLRPRPAQPDQAAGPARWAIGSRQGHRRGTEPSPREDFGNNLSILYPSICDSNRHKRTLNFCFTLIFLFFKPRNPLPPRNSYRLTRLTNLRLLL
ncbi:protein CBFA2T2 isoform X3 [Rhea pennata]|uniref:protein CBFA2T2 isoform X3 n=1 Tax=Rhea pennata TaxID=8795 RepID=UPI002E274F1A